MWGSYSKERISVRIVREGGSPIMQGPVPPEILVPRFLVPRSWYQDLDTKILVPRSWCQDLGTKIQNPGIGLIFFFCGASRVHQVIVGGLVQKYPILGEKKHDRTLTATALLGEGTMPSMWLLHVGTTYFTAGEYHSTLVLLKKRKHTFLATKGG